MPDKSKRQTIQIFFFRILYSFKYFLFCRFFQQCFCFSRRQFVYMEYTAIKTIKEMSQKLPAMKKDKKRAEKNIKGTPYLLVKSQRIYACYILRVW